VPRSLPMMCVPSSTLAIRTVARAIRETSAGENLVRLTISCLIVAILPNLLVHSARAQSPPVDAVKLAGTVASQQSLAQPRRFETNHQGVFGGQPLHYKAIVAENFLTNPAGKRTASIFTTSYIRTDVPKGTGRPVIFVFNGGPGSSSIWLHMGFVGPRRIDFADVLKPETVPPFHTVDNKESPLDAADIVLIDPPGTGFSRVLPDGKPEEFYGTAQDAKATVDLIEGWVRENNRWNAPKYLLSESYGTIRAAVVSRLLAGGPTETGSMDGVTLNGVILLGQALDFKGSAGEDGGYLNLLPTLAATGCYYGKTPPGCSPATQVAEARIFAADAYLKALYAGTSLPPAERDAIAARLAVLTGLSSDFIRRNNLRISAAAFAQEILKDRDKQVGAYDTRYTLPLSPNGKDPVADDPAMGQYVPGFVASYNMYAREELGVSIDETYEAISFRAVNARWDYGRGPGAGADTNYATDLSIAMRRNPHLRLMIGAGYYDLVTTIGAADYVIAHAGFPPDATVLHLYPSGHMPYLGTEARQMLARDVRSFITGEHKSP
jgi:carboxypeptidase C (cathepsin A)